MKDSDLDPKESGLQNPYRILLFKLTGVGIVCPRLRSPVNTWRKIITNRDAIEKEAKARGELELSSLYGINRLSILDSGYTKKSAATVRAKISNKWFEALDDEEKAEWKELAQLEHDEAVLQFKQATTSPPSTDPVDRQR